MRDSVDCSDIDALRKHLEGRLEKQGEASRESDSEMREIIDGLTRRLSVLESEKQPAHPRDEGFSRKIYNPLTVFLCGAIFGLLLALV